MTLVRRPLYQRFWEKVDTNTQEGGCWLWTASLRNGYGQLGRSGHQGEGKMPYYAHRLAYSFAHSIDPDRLDGEICHTCDNRACCNPAHLVLGTRKDNLREAAERQRAHWTRTTRDSHGRFT